MFDAIFKYFKHLPRYAQVPIALVAVAAVSAAAWYIVQRLAEESRLAKLKRIDQENDSWKKNDDVGRIVAEHREAARKAIADGAYELAEAEARKAIDLRDDLPAAVYRGRALQQLGRPKEAQLAVEQARGLLARPVAADTELEAEFYTLAGELAEDEGRRGERAGRADAAERFRAALASYDRAIALRPTWSRPRQLRDGLAGELALNAP